MPPGQTTYSTYTIPYSDLITSSSSVTATSGPVTISSDYQTYQNVLQDYAYSVADIDDVLSIKPNVEQRIEEIVEEKLCKILGKKAFMLGLIKKETGDHDGD